MQGTELPHTPPGCLVPCSGGRAVAGQGCGSFLPGTLRHSLGLSVGSSGRLEGTRGPEHRASAHSLGWRHLPVSQVGHGSLGYQCARLAPHLTLPLWALGPRPCTSCFAVGSSFLERGRVGTRLETRAIKQGCFSNTPDSGTQSYTRPLTNTLLSVPARETHSGAEPGSSLPRAGQAWDGAGWYLGCCLAGYHPRLAALAHLPALPPHSSPSFQKSLI